MEGADSGQQTGGSETGGGSQTGGSGESGVQETTGAVPGDDSSGGLSSTGGGGSEDGGDEPDDDVDQTTGELPEPPTGDFACIDARWVFVDTQPRWPFQVRPTVGGHVLVHNTLGVLDLDPAGSVAVDHDVSAVSDRRLTGGPDGAGNWFLSFVDDTPQHHRWLRKFDPAGQLVWEVDQGGVQPEPLSADAMKIVVAPNGATLLTDPEDKKLHKFDADGNALWSLQPIHYLDVHAMNDAGEIAALSPYEEAGPHVLEADGSLRWNFVWDSAGETYGRIAINAAGEVVVGAAWVGVQIKRFSPTGELLWNNDYSGMPGRINYLGQLAINDAGEVALGGRTLEDSGVIVTRLAADGALLESKLCNVDSRLTDITIDNAGVIYAAGFVDEVAYLPFVAVFD